MDKQLVVFEDKQIRRVWDELREEWHFSVIDIIAVLVGQVDFQLARNYWKVLKNRLTKEGSEVVTKCNRLKLIATDGKSRFTDYWKNHEITKEQEYAILTNIIHSEWADVSVSQHKKIKGLKSQNLRDHTTDAELIFTALAELSTREIAQTGEATGMRENAQAGKQGGKIAKNARVALESKTGKKVVSPINYLAPRKTKRIE